MPCSVTIIDYGMGNIWSVASALKYLGYKSTVTSNITEITNSDCLILPGVGSFRKAMVSIENLELDKAICAAVGSGIKLLGICLGMQLLGTSSTEDGYYKGLGLIPNSVEKFTKDETGDLKIPHIGFNAVDHPNDSVLFQGVSKKSDFYFVHSYRMLPQSPEESILCRYGINFLAGYENKNIFATQFHPEKSQTNGLLVLRNFLEYKTYA
jgi:glutamine amidotransferase